ncbi:unnamed protein product [Mycena citricolor]|uniref:Secreted protein n=1 Tax=Mycena citricolor TaxID=2018698 RepID=A0AAD2HRT5_9AGAR|nr:unnamed protein product [Mycena citricolor]CAK5280500.1 unnamed protein product [Mycena citricolor]
MSIQHRRHCMYPFCLSVASLFTWKCVPAIIEQTSFFTCSPLLVLEFHWPIRQVTFAIHKSPRMTSSLRGNLCWIHHHRPLVLCSFFSCSSVAAVTGNTLRVTSETQMRLVMSPVASATRCEIDMKAIEVASRLSSLHCGPGMTTRTPLVSAARKKWNCRMNSSREHLPAQMNTSEDMDRSAGVAFRKTANASTGSHEIYGCHVLYVNLDSCPSSKAKNQTSTTPDNRVAPLTRVGQCRCSTSLCSRHLMTATAAS